MTSQYRIASKCLTKEEIFRNTGKEGLVLNSDGTVSVYYNSPDFGLYPVQLTLECCRVLDPTYYFDINTQTCRWAKPKDTCGFSEPINLIINPKENDGTLFFIDDFQKEKCDLKISFDYLLKIKCEDLLNIANPTIATNIQSEETIKQIVKTQMSIQETNVQIESISNQIVKLNTEYLNTPYSMECAQFPVVITTPDPVNCAVSAWSAWSTCVNGTQSQTRTITTQPANGGTPCPVLTQTQSCTIVTAPCVPPLNMSQRNFYFQNGSTVFKGSEASACAAAQLTNGLWAWNVPYLVNGIIAVGVKVYSSTSTPCEYLADGYYITNLSTKEITHVVQGTVVSITNCAAAAVCNNYNVQTSFPGNVLYTNCAGTPNQVQFVSGNATICARAGSIMGAISATPIGSCNTAAKVAAFDKSSFSEVATDLTANLDVYQKGSTITYIYVNYCLTDLGLQVWEGILNASGGSYQGFILGNPTSYTCADVIALANQPNAAQLFYDCDVPFGTKSEILVQINELLSQLAELNIILTQLENELIKLENTFTSSSTSTRGCTSMIDALESLDIEMHLDIVNADNSLTSVFSAATFQAINSTTNLYDYLIDNPNSGFYICGDPSKDNVGLSNCTTLSLDEDVEPNVDSCNSIVEDLIDGLAAMPGADINNISYNAFASQWLTYSTVINDPVIIGLITNKKIKISFKINFSCVDFCLLLDNFVLDKSCRSVDRNDITISQNPGFDLKRVIDNKKSWIDNTSPTNREFLISKSNGNNPIRQTDYDVNDERLVINSKEIDLDICVASAIETDVWCYLNDNSCALTDECTSTIASTDNNPFIDGQTIVFSGTAVTIADCTNYNSILANRIAEFIQTTECGTILRFKFKTTEGFPPTLISYYYWLVQQPNGDVEFYYQNATTFINLSNVYQNGRECCEYLNIDLKTYNKAASQADDFEVYWDEDCQRCKVQKAKCGDVNLNLHSLVTEPISGVTTIEQFENLMTGQFIDAKNRQTISSYPTLRAIYERYLNSSEHCGTVSSAFDYQNMDRFSNLIGNYWIDLIEQVVPSTTIWGSVKIYTNTIFDEQKFKYKPYSILLCKNPFIGEHVLSPINGVNGLSQGVNVISRDLRGNKKDTLDWYTTNQVGELVMLPSSEQPRQAIPSGIVLDEPRPRPRIKSPVNVCDNMYIAQMNSGSEFISYINIPLPEVIEEPIPCVDCTNKDIDLSSQNLNLGYMVNNSDNSKVYVSDYNGKIIVINTLTDTIVTTITGLGYGIRYMVCHPTNNNLYVINRINNTVIVINTLTDMIIGSPITIGNTPEQGTYVAYNNYIYITNFDSNDVSVINTATNLVVATITVGDQPNNMVYNSDLRLLYVFNITDGTTSVIDVVTNSVITTINVGNANNNLVGYYVAYNQHLYVYNPSNSSNGELFVIDTITNNIIGNSMQVNGFGQEFTFNPLNKYLYLTSGGVGIVVINTTNDTIVTTLNVNSEKAIYVPLTNNIYAGYNNGTLTTINNSNTSIGTNTVFPKSQYGIFNSANESIYVCGPYGINIIKCVNNKPKSQTNIKECTLGVTISNLIIQNVNTLTAITSGGIGPFTYLWSNGATTASINATNSGKYTVKVTDTSNCCVATAEFGIIGQKACWFSMAEKPEYVMGAFYQDLYGVCSVNDYPTNEVTFNVWEIVINGNPITIPAPPLSTTMTPSNVNWVSALNDIVYRCTPGNVTGQTYTNYVDFLNLVFNTLGLTGYKAQVSLKAQKVGDGYYNENNGFYIIYPATDTFKIKTESTNNMDKYIYSNDGISDWNPDNTWRGYNKSFCDGIVVTNGTVIE